MPVGSVQTIVPCIDGASSQCLHKINPIRDLPYLPRLHIQPRKHSPIFRNPASIPLMAHKNIIEANHEVAEIYTGDDLCRQKSIDLLEELDLPRGLLPMDGNVEVLAIIRI